MLTCTVKLAKQLCTAWATIITRRMTNNKYDILISQSFWKFKVELTSTKNKMKQKDKTKKFSCNDRCAHAPTDKHRILWQSKSQWQKVAQYRAFDATASARFLYSFPLPVGFISSCEFAATMASQSETNEPIEPYYIYLTNSVLDAKLQRYIAAYVEHIAKVLEGPVQESVQDASQPQTMPRNRVVTFMPERNGTI